MLLWINYQVGCFERAGALNEIEPNSRELEDYEEKEEYDRKIIDSSSDF